MTWPDGHASPAMPEDSEGSREDTCEIVESPRTLRRLPLYFFFAYLTFTVLLFAFGPWPWPVTDGLKLYGFLALAHTALVAGYLSGERSRLTPYTGRFSVESMLATSVFVSLVLLVPTLLYRTSGLADFTIVFSDPGRAYDLAGAAPLDASEFRLVEYVRIFLGPMLYMVLPLTVVYWHRLRRWLRVLAVIAILGELSVWVAMATNKGIADALVVLPWLLLAQAWLVHGGEFRLRSLLRTAGVLLAGGLIVAAVFVRFVSARHGQAAIDWYYADVDVGVRSSFSPNVSTEISDAVVGLSSYLSQGYYALSLGLEEPFVPMWGLGNSMYLTGIAEKISGDARLHERSYPGRIEKRGWRAYTHFHTFYLWVASDVGFPGAIVVVFLLGRLLAVSWTHTLEGSNPFAVALFFNVLLLFYYIPANNQIMQFPEHTSSFLVALAAFWVTRRPKKAMASAGGMEEPAPGEEEVV